MRHIWRLTVVAVVAAAAFGVAITRFSDAAERGCAQRAREDTSYSVTFVDPPRMDLTQYRLAVSQGGRAVTGAEVCLNTYMQGMSAMATTDTGREVSPGTYEVTLIFQMGGIWKGRVLIAEPNKPVAAVPLTLDVGEAIDGPVDDGGTTTTVSTTTTTVPPETTVAPTTTTDVPAEGVEPVPGTPGAPAPGATDPPAPDSTNDPTTNGGGGGGEEGGLPSGVDGGVGPAPGSRSGFGPDSEPDS